MFRLYRYLKYFKKEVILGPMFKLVEAIFELIVPLVMADIIDYGIKNGDVNYIWQRGLILLALALIGLGSTLVCQIFASKASQGFGTILRNELFVHINKLSYSEINKVGTPSLITRITNDIDQMQLSVAMLIRLVVRAPFLVIGATIMAFTIDAKIASIFVISALIMAVILYFIMSKSIPFFKTIQGKLDRTSKITRENLSGARIVRAFSKADEEIERFSKATDDVTKANIRVSKISSLLSPLSFMVINVAIICIIYFGGISVDTGSLSQGEVLALVNYMNQILLALVVVANLVVIFTKATASAARINECFDLSSSVIDGNMNFGEDKDLFTFDNVSFSFPDSSEYAIDNISFKIKENQTFGIIGGTGSGKSTVVSLLERLYDATNGKVIYRGNDIKNYSQNQLRNEMGIVLQRAVLFKGTIRDNMKLRKKDATDEEIIEALKIAQAYDFVNEIGLDYKIVQGGKNLSGGQRQRLTIARALVGDPKILILDDSSSALDLKTDYNLRQALKKLKLTTIIISQRATSIKNADQILVLDDGRSVGLGTHEELLNSCSVYQEICNSQMPKEVEL